MGAPLNTRMETFGGSDSEAQEHVGAASPRPRLAYVVNSLNPGGTEKLVFEMSLAFSAEFDVHVVCLDEVGVWGRELRARGVPVHCVWRQAGLDLTMPRKLAELFRRLDVRLVHAHQCTPWFYAALSRLFYRSPRLLFEEHGRFYPEVVNRPRAFVNRALIRRLTHRSVAVSEDIRERLQRFEGLDAKDIDVIYNGVAPEPLLTAAERRSLRTELGFGEDDFIVGTVGRFDAIKNLPMLIESFAQARARVPTLRGLLVGDGPERGRVQQMLERAGLTERVQLTGYRADARALVQCMDLFVLSSLSEGTSMALLEAMAAGVPSAVTRVGGNPEIVMGGRTGWVVESGAVNELAEAICDAALDAVKRQRFAAAARQRFAERFEFNRMISAYAQHYRELLGDRSTSKRTER